MLATLYPYFNTDTDFFHTSFLYKHNLATEIIGIIYLIVYEFS
jgi:hypothetical protein